MKRKALCALMLVPAMAFTIGSLSACDLTAGNTEKYVISVEQEAGDTQDKIIIYYSDGTSETLTVTHGKDGKDGKDGESAPVSADDLYEKYVKEGGTLTYEEFLQKYLSANEDFSYAAARALQSSMKVYVETANGSLYSGSAVIYQMDDASTYILTNYHVVFPLNSDLPLSVKAYLYGSEYKPAKSGTSIVYGESALDCEYIGGAATCDVVVLRIDTPALKAINPDARAAVCAEEEAHVGQSVIAIGNAESEGISVTKGIVSMEDEDIELRVSGKNNVYRALRIDAALYEGNSGGGLFNGKGELIALNNAGGGSDNQNINYSIPLPILTGIADNILYHHAQNSSQHSGYKITVGVTVKETSSKYVFDSNKGYGRIYADITVDSVTAHSIASNLQLSAGDVLLAMNVNGNKIPLRRSFVISDILLTVRAGDKISFDYLRADKKSTTQEYTVQQSDLNAIS